MTDRNVPPGFSFNVELSKYVLTNCCALTENLINNLRQYPQSVVPSEVTKLAQRPDSEARVAALGAAIGRVYHDYPQADPARVKANLSADDIALLQTCLRVESTHRTHSRFLSLRGAPNGPSPEYLAQVEDMLRFFA